ncbi:unnamed protein product [Amoebophrya sp. A25]|nr:unnamed protein product [Amoebophrya sp. A25]|eukprot:GSA25T00015120001.1
MGVLSRRGAELGAEGIHHPGNESVDFESYSSIEVRSASARKPLWPLFEYKAVLDFLESPFEEKNVAGTTAVLPQRREFNQQFTAFWTRKRSEHFSIALYAAAGECFLSVVLPAAAALIFTHHIPSSGRKSATPSSSIEEDATQERNAHLLLFLALVSWSLNTGGCLLEGLAAHRHAQLDPGFSAGFLSVITSFPDIGDTAKDLILQVRDRDENFKKAYSIFLGLAYCCSGIFTGCVAFRTGSRFHAALPPAFPQLACHGILTATLVIILYRWARGDLGRGVLFDLARGDLQWPAGAVSGLFFGCFLSAVGACVGTLIVEIFRRFGLSRQMSRVNTDISAGSGNCFITEEDPSLCGGGDVESRGFGICDASELRDRVDSRIREPGRSRCQRLGMMLIPKTAEEGEICGRAVNNLIACILCILIRTCVLFFPALATNFVLYKMAGSFCGALSSMSGTIADIAARLPPSLDRQRERRTNIVNVGVHFLILVVFMLLVLHLATIEPILLSMRGSKSILQEGKTIERAKGFGNFVDDETF